MVPRLKGLCHGDKIENNAIIAGNTIRDTLFAGRARLSHREPERLQSKHGSKTYPTLDASLENRQISFQQNSASRSATREWHDSDEQVELPKLNQQKRVNTGKIFYRKQIAEVRAIEKHLSGKTEETQASIANLEKLKEEQKTEARVARLSLK